MINTKPYVRKKITSNIWSLSVFYYCNFIVFAQSFCSFYSGVDDITDLDWVISDFFQSRWLSSVAIFIALNQSIC